MGKRRKDGRSIFKAVKRLQGLFGVLRENMRKYTGDNIAVSEFKKKRDGTWFASEKQQSFVSQAGEWFSKITSGPLGQVDALRSGMSEPNQPRDERAFRYGQMVGGVLAHWSQSFKNALTPPPPTYWKSLQGMGGMKSYDQFGSERGQQQGTGQLSIHDFDSSSIRAARADALRLPGYDAWIRHLSGPANLEKRAFSPITRNLGGRILQMGPLVPDETRAKAAIAANGTSNPDVEEKDLLGHMRDSLGIEESGASRFRSISRGIRSGFHHALKYGMLASFASEGGMRGAIASSQLGLHALDDSERLLNSQAMSMVAEKFASWITKNPLDGSKLIGAIGRTLRSGGAVAQAAIVGYQAYALRVENSMNAAESWGQETKAVQQFGDIKTAQRLSVRVSQGYDKYKNFVTSLMDWTGYHESQSDKAKITTELLAGREFLRSNPSMHGVNAAKAISEYARLKGVPVQFLTQMQRNEAIDQAVEAHPLPFTAAEINAAKSAASDFVSMTKYQLGMPESYEEHYKIEIEKEHVKFLRGTGNYAADPASPSNKRIKWFQDYDLKVQGVKAEVKYDLKYSAERLAREAVGMQNRRQVQRFD